MTYLRHLPVYCAGPPLTAMQSAIACWGSFLIIPPWMKIDDGTDVSRLAKFNLICYWALTMLVCDEVIVEVTLYVVYHIAYAYTSVCMRQQIASAPVSAASAPHKRRHSTTG